MSRARLNPMLLRDCCRCWLTIVWCMAPPILAMEHVTVERKDSTIQLAGEIIVEAKDGGMLLMAQDGTLWALQPDEITNRRSDDEPFTHFDKSRMISAVESDLPTGFEVHSTAHYLIFYNTDRSYAQWCGSLYERLYRGFFNYWKKRGLTLHEPASPLVALVFDRQAAYQSYSQGELGDAAKSIVGYYSLRTNRVAMYDLTGRGELRTAEGRPKSSSLVNQVLSQPAAAPMVATIIHEATHQLAYNSGLQTRYADNPLWLSEGLAIFFESPDLKSAKGWRSIGSIHMTRLAQLRRDFQHRQPDALINLLTDDQQLRQADTAASGYAHAWGLCFFLAKRHRQAFADYIEELSHNQPMGTDSPQQRLKVFQKHFGPEIERLDREFVEYMQKLRV